MPQAGPRKRKPAHERGMSAWLVTWEEHPPRQLKAARERIVSILGPRTKAETVKAIVEALHNSAHYTLSEQAGFANRRTFDALPAEYALFDGTRYLGRITCGHNPYLYARLVDKLKITGHPGDEEVTWIDRPLPEKLRVRLSRLSLEGRSASE